MTKMLKIAQDLDFPLDAVTQKLAFLGKTGSGKTYGAKRMVEQMLRAGAQVVVLDPQGVWAGLRLGPKSFDIPVLGGLYGDIDLDPSSGALVADVIVDHATSMVVDVSQMLDAEMARFATAFALRMFQRKKAAPSAMHFVLEECQDFCPQNPQPGEQHMLHEFIRWAKQGRSLGMGISFLSQRPQEISKKALNQAECVIAFQLTGPHERKALEYWLSDKGFGGEKLGDLLPKLDVGCPHIWSPQWLKVSRVMQILPIDTLDTSQTPKVGEATFDRQNLKPINMKALRVAMAATADPVERDDPKALKALVAELRKQLAARPATEPERVEVQVITEAQLSRLEIAAAEMQKAGLAAVEASRDLIGALPTSSQFRPSDEAPKTQPSEKLRKTAPDLIPNLPKTGQSDPKQTSKPTTKVVEAGNGPRHAEVGDSGLARLLIVLADEQGKPLSRKAAALRARLAYGGSTFDTYVSRARGMGWIQGKSELTITMQGAAALGVYEPLPKGRGVFKWWLSDLGGGGIARLFEVLGKAYPKELKREEAAKLSELAYGGSTFDTYVSRLRGLSLIEGKSTLKACPELFGGAR